jgi:DNA mismatch repair protein MutS
VSFPDGGDRPDSPVGVAVVDLSTGAFVLLDSTVDALPDELVRRHVTELLYSTPAVSSDGQPPTRVAEALRALGVSGTGQPAWHFRREESLEIVKRVFGVAALGGFGLRDDDIALPAAGAVLRYLQSTQPGAADDRDAAAAVNPRAPRATLSHLQPPRREDPSGYCVLDATSLRSLEVLSTIRGGGGVGRGETLDGSLAGIFATSRVFPGCRTAMGKRLVRDWLCRPLCDLDKIQGRQRCVATLVEDRQTAASLAATLGEVQDIARIAGRIALARATPRDVVALGRSLAEVRRVEAALANAPAFEAHRAAIASVARELLPLSEQIARTCVESPPTHLREGGLVKDGVDAALDEARLLQRDAASWMADYQSQLISKHDLPSLKVGYNKIFGYYIELPSAQAKRAPDAFSRKQTLKNAERYTTPELRDFESKVSTAQARAIDREQLIFEQLCSAAAALIERINAFADTAAELDVLACFAEKASRRRWVRPEVVADKVINIVQGRHPVLDELLENNFVPNDVELGGASNGADTPHLALITGPNMAGKSTFIRQTALLVLLAHTGCFIPAQSAVVGLTDRIFTRVGADDALHAGQSTFMVEMTETARILNHATARSLVILDEIGRGTSTLDGLSLAWAIAETLAGNAEHAPSPRTLFATHYHELTDLEEMLPGRVKNLHVSVREWGDQIVFLHRILPGRTDQSYGIHVAKLAGMPSATVARAREVLQSLAVHHGLNAAAQERGAARSVPGDGAPMHDAPGTRSGVKPAARNGQLGLFTEYLHHPAIDALREIKLDALSPIQAFDQLRALKESVDHQSGARSKGH